MLSAKGQSTTVRRPSSRPSIRTPHLDRTKARRRCSVSGSHHLLRLPLAAVRRAPQGPFIARADGIHGIPEVRRDARIRWILQHAAAFSFLDLPANLTAKLKVVALVVDGPRLVGFHVNAVVGTGNQLLKRERLLARKNADVRHADHRQPVPAFGAQRAARSIGPNGMGGLARTQVSGEEAIGDDWSALCGDTFIIECKRAKTRTMLLPRIRYDVHKVAAVAQLSKLVKRKKRRASEIGFHPQHAVEFDRVPHRLVNLQPQLRTVENNGERPFRTLIS